MICKMSIQVRSLVRSTAFIRYYLLNETKIITLVFFRLQQSTFSNTYYIMYSSETYELLHTRHRRDRG